MTDFQQQYVDQRLSAEHEYRNQLVEEAARTGVYAAKGYDLRAFVEEIHAKAIELGHEFASKFGLVKHDAEVVAEDGAKEVEKVEPIIDEADKAVDDLAPVVEEAVPAAKPAVEAVKEVADEVAKEADDVTPAEAKAVVDDAIEDAGEAAAKVADETPAKDANKA